MILPFNSCRKEASPVLLEARLYQQSGTGNAGLSAFIQCLETNCVGSFYFSNVCKISDLFLLLLTGRLFFEYKKHVWNTFRRRSASYGRTRRSKHWEQAGRLLYFCDFCAFLRPAYPHHNMRIAEATHSGKLDDPALPKIPDLKKPAGKKKRPVIRGAFQDSVIGDRGYSTTVGVTSSAGARGSAPSTSSTPISSPSFTGRMFL